MREKHGHKFYLEINCTFGFLIRGAIPLEVFEIFNKDFNEDTNYSIRLKIAESTESGASTVFRTS